MVNQRPFRRAIVLITNTVVVNDVFAVQLTDKKHMTTVDATGWLTCQLHAVLPVQMIRRMKVD